MSPAALRERGVWIFDLDNTLYDADHALFPQIEPRMTRYIADLVGVPLDEARTLQARYLVEHGATLTGLIRNHNCDPHDFLHYVHEVDLAPLCPDRGLAELIARLPGRKLVFTNGSRRHADRVVEALGLAGLFEAHFAIEDAGLVGKPQPEAFERLIVRHGVDPARAVMLEDTARNLAPAHALGMATVLVDRRGVARPEPHVHHVTDALARFLAEVLAAP